MRPSAPSGSNAALSCNHLLLCLYTSEVGWGRGEERVVFALSEFIFSTFLLLNRGGRQVSSVIGSFKRQMVPAPKNNCSWRPGHRCASCRPSRRPDPSTKKSVTCCLPGWWPSWHPWLPSPRPASRPHKRHNCRESSRERGPINSHKSGRQHVL